MSSWKASDLKGKKFRSVEGIDLQPEANMELSEIARGIFIPGDVISSKNSKNIAYKNGKPYIEHSEAAKRYKIATVAEYMKFSGAFQKMVADIPKPFYVALKFLRATNGKFDANNLTQMVADLMVECGWIEDDDDKTIRFIPMNTIYRSPTPGVIIFV